MKNYSPLRQKPRKSACVCVAGCGQWGRNLVRNFHALGHLGAICEANPAALAKFAAEYPGLPAYASFSEALENPEIDAVALATPAELHHAGPAVGEHNREVYGGLLGLSDAELADLAREGVV